MRGGAIRFSFWLLSLGLLVASANADVKTGLVAYYPMEEGEGSVVHNAVQGTIGENGNASGGYTWVQGKVGNFALKFNGLFGTVVDCGTWNPSRETGQLTVAVWMRWEGTNGGWQGVVSKRDGWTATDTCWNLEIDRDTSDLGFHRYDSYPDFGVNVPKVGQWQHVAVTFDGATIAMYINGSSVGSSTAFSFGPKTGAHVVFGAVEGTGANPFNGTLDEVRIYDRALSPEDIVELLNWVGGADAGADQRVYGGDRVTLSGTGPSDATSFTWQQINIDGKPEVTLDTPTQPTAHFTAPSGHSLGCSVMHKVVTEKPLS